ncbi:venom protease-like isoform X2 [Eriocheir sinensis]|uniref:venom protease-like isoform X2 n=1 Tax=Eriocheir sinensis TaxID=95602 RepID=UPI0021C83E0B|nr:venom protease-like isoform X2 [Eriocheir sinensis]
MAFSNRVNGSLAFLCLLIMAPIRKRATALGQVVFPADEPCRLETGEVGGCLPLTDCPPVLQSFRERQPVRCGFEGPTLIVCCPKSQDSTTGPRQDALDVSPPSGYDTLNCGGSAVRTTDSFGEHFSSSVSGLSRQKRTNVPLPEHNKPTGVDIRKVVDGQISVRAAWPWIALLGQNDTAGTNWFCGGALINEHWVLSAAHCFRETKADVVRLGEHDYTRYNDGASHVDFGVLNLIYYPDYKPAEAYHDLALLKLDSKVKLQSFIRPVCLPFGKRIEENMTDAVATVAGWGNTLNGGFPSSVLMEANVQVFPSSRCDRSYSTIPEYPTQWPRGIGDETLCAGDLVGNKDACQGDSGGPLVSKDDRGRFVLAGIVSRGFGCGHRDYPGLYANMRHSPYLAWIKKVVFSTQ